MKRLGQIAVLAYPRTDNLMVDIKASAPTPIHHLTKIGIQMPQDKLIIIEKQDFIVGKTGRLEFDDVNITGTIYVKDRYNDSNLDLIPIVIDYVYEDKE